MKKLFYGSLVFIAIGFYACDGSTTTTTANDSLSTVSSDTLNINKSETGNMTAWSENDRNFAQEAIRGGKMEVALGNIAKANASAQEVKDFGKMMVDDHSTANDELTKLLKDNNVDIDMEFTNDQQNEIDKMSKEKGQAFDKDYVKMMLEDHQKDVGDFKQASQSVSNSDLKSWIDKTLPVLEKHLDAIQKINGSMK